MPTAYLSPAQLQDLTNVSSTAPGSGDNGKALVWNQADGQWQAQQVAYSNLSGAPALPIPVLSGGTGTQTGSITGTGALTFASSANGDISLTPNGTGKTVIGNQLDVSLRSQPYIQTGLNINLQANQSNINNGVFVTKGNSVFSIVNATSLANSFSPVFQGVIDPAQTNQNACLIFSSLFSNTATPPFGVTSFWVRDQIGPTTPLGDSVICFGFWNTLNEAGQANPSGLLFRILGNGNANLKGGLVIRGAEASTSTTTGALQVAGGIGAQGAINASGQIATTGDSFRIATAAAPTPTSAGATGEIRWGQDYIYICTTGGSANNAIWKRAAISTWT